MTSSWGSKSAMKPSSSWRHCDSALPSFGLELHPDKTRLIEFGRFARERRQERGLGKPESFNFLGFTHVCGQSRKGRFQVMRRTMAQRLRTKLAEIKAELRRRRHQPVPQAGSLAPFGVVGPLSVLRRAVKRQGPATVPEGGLASVAAQSLTAKSERLRQLDAHEPLRGQVAPCGPHLSSVSKRAFWREDLRQEPSAVVPLAGICAGGAW